MELIHWIHENMWVLSDNDVGSNIVVYIYLFLSIYVMLQSFTYPFITKYGTLFLSITRGAKNEKRRSGIVQFIAGFAFLSVTIKPLIIVSLIIFAVGILLSFLDSGSD